MCGIAGFYYFAPPPADVHARLEAMSRIMRHRGPDADGVFVDEPVWLAHRRLAIIDLQTGDQPMSSSDGRLHVIYNGEIYNYRELRDQLTGFSFRTHSDTEVLLAAYERWGPCFASRLNGIFAFALWDAERRRLLLARDPLGVKPLHVHQNAGRLAFASEIKSLLALPDVARQIDPQAVHDFMNVRYVPGHHTLFEGIHRIEPGKVMIVDRAGARKQRYFDWHVDVDRRASAGEWRERIVDGVKTAVDRQLMSDVPLGVYLSGGLDSSAIVAMMHALETPNIRTFSLGFNEPSDELDDAALVARHFGTEHVPMMIDPEPLEQMRRVLWHVEEPQVNMLQGFCIAEHAARQTKVVLSGLGGDELFAGYVTDIYLKASAPLHRLVPQGVERHLLRRLSRAVYRISRRLNVSSEEYRRGLQLLLSAGNPARYYSILRNVWDHDPAMMQLVYGERMTGQRLQPTARHFRHYFHHGLRSDIVSDALWLELNSKMIDDFLLSEDRVSMAHGLEVRVPLLDLDLVRLAFSIPARHKMPGLSPKQLFREALAPHLPPQTIRKKKWGFSFNPYYQFQKDLKDACEEGLSRERVDELGLFNYAFIRRILDHPPHPRLRWHYFMLWVMLGFHQWHEMFIEGRGLESQQTRVAA